jgi:predicted DCC family thiol-disulfide oxidoreductase YuxK
MGDVAEPRAVKPLAKTKVYYNSACPVCNAGIRYQQRKLGTASDDVEWIDVHSRNEAACDVNPDLEVVRERLHVVDNEGDLHVGADAFAELWSKTPGQTAWARIARTPGLRIFGQGIYNGFAALLYRWNRINRRW